MTGKYLSLTENVSTIFQQIRANPYPHSGVVNGTKIQSGPLSDVHVVVVHTGDQIAECIRQCSLQAHDVPQWSGIHESRDQSDPFDCSV